MTGDDPSRHPFQFHPLRALNPAISVETERAITRSLAQSPDQRWQSTDKLRTSLLASPSASLAGRTGGPGPAGSASTRPGGSRPITTRLLMAMSAMSTEQLVAVIAGVVVLFAVLTATLGPVIRDDLPWLWRSIPLYAAAASAVWAASHRRWSALATHALVTLLVLTISGGTRIEYIAGALVGAAVIEGGVALGHYRRSDALWLVGVTVAGWIAQTLITSRFGLAPSHIAPRAVSDDA